MLEMLFECQNDLVFQVSTIVLTSLCATVNRSSRYKAGEAASLIFFVSANMYIMMTLVNYCLSLFFTIVFLNNESLCTITLPVCILNNRSLYVSIV